MAVTTINDKFALMSWMLPWQLPLPVSADGLGQADTQHLLWGYPGVLWAVAVAPALRVAVFGVFTMQPRVDGTWTMNEEPAP